MDNYRLFINKKPLKDGTFRYTDSNGRVKYIMLKVFNKPRPNGYMYQGVFIDITEEINNAIKLKENTFYLNLLSQYTDDIVFTYNIESDKIEYVSQSIYKYIVDDDINIVKDKFFQEYFAENFSSKIHDYFTKAKSDNGSINGRKSILETVLYKQKKTPIWVDISLYYIDSDSGAKILGIIRDIDEKKKYLSEMEQANQRFWYAARATSDAIWDWYLESDMFSWTENLEYYFGHQLKELPSTIQALLSFCHPEEVNDVYNSLKNTINEKINYWEYQHRFRNSKGDYKFVHNRAVLIMHEDRVHRIIGAIHT